jgi:hypothetical protein
MPKEYLFDISSWNIIVHANITGVALLFLFRYGLFEPPSCPRNNPP